MSADEGPVHVEVPLARAPVRAGHRMADRRVLRLRGAALVPRHGVPEGLGEVVHRVQRVDLLLRRLVQRVVGRVHVGEQGVAAHLGDLERVQDGSHGRALPPGDVVVPRVLVAAHLRRLLEAHQLGLPGVRRQEGVNLQLAEAPGERDVLSRGQGLVPEEDDLVVVQRLAQLGDDVVGQLGRQVDARDLRPARRAQHAGVEGAPAQCGQAVPLGRHVREGADDDRVPRQGEGPGRVGLRRRHVGTVPKGHPSSRVGVACTVAVRTVSARSPWRPACSPSPRCSPPAARANPDPHRLRRRPVRSGVGALAGPNPAQLTQRARIRDE